MVAMSQNAQSLLYEHKSLPSIRCQDVAQASHMVGAPVRQDDEFEICEINALCFHVGGERLTVRLNSDRRSSGGAPADPFSVTLWSG